MVRRFPREKRGKNITIRLLFFLNEPIAGIQGMSVKSFTQIIFEDLTAQGQYQPILNAQKS